MMKTRRNFLVHAAALAALAGALALPAFPQAKGSAAEAGAISGPDREKRLLEGAKKEGNLVIYTSAQSDDMGALVQAFEKKYGLKVEVWRSSSEKVLQRAIQEARANKNTMDVAETNGPELESLSREKISVKLQSPYLADLIPEAIRPHGEWVGTRLNVFVQAYNTGQVKKADLPKTWEELAQPKWKGKLGIEQEDADWLMGEFAQLGEARAQKVFKDIVANNGVSVRKGHTLLTQLVVSGEIPLALTVYNYKAEQLKNKGAPIDWFTIGPAIARPNGIAINKNAPHPYAAMLFLDFEIGPEGQKILAGRDFVPTSRKVDTPLNKVPMKFVDAASSLDQGQKFDKLYQELFIRQAR
jgi:iron(III) transport system substrate-binding protein